MFLECFKKQDSVEKNINRFAHSKVEVHTAILSHNEKNSLTSVFVLFFFFF